MVLKKIILFSLLFLAVILILTFLIKPSKTLPSIGKIIQDNQENQNKNLEINEFSYTRAICNETNFCQDYEIVCKNNQVAGLTPITGAFIQHPDDWIDPRNDTKNLCS